MDEVRSSKSIIINYHDYRIIKETNLNLFVKDIFILSLPKKDTCEH